MIKEEIKVEVIEEEPQEFSIIPIQDETTKVFSIQNYEELFSRINKWCQTNNPTGLIKSQADYDYYLKDKPKSLKEGNTYSLRVKAASLKELVATVRKGIIKSTMGVFEEQAKAIENALTEYDNICKLQKVEWLKATTNKVDKPTFLKLEVKSYDQKIIEKVKAYALKLGCEVK